jgi:hypothetical protein
MLDQNPAKGSLKSQSDGLNVHIHSAVGFYFLGCLLFSDASDHIAKLGRKPQLHRTICPSKITILMPTLMGPN